MVFARPLSSQILKSGLKHKKKSSRHGCREKGNANIYIYSISYIGLPTLFFPDSQGCHHLISALNHAPAENLLTYQLVFISCERLLQFKSD